MSRSVLSSDAGVRFVRRRGPAALVVAVWLGAAGVVGAGDVPASLPAATAGNSPTSRPEQSAAPTTAKAYFELALQETARITDRNDQAAAYGNIMVAQLATGDIAAAQQMLPRIADKERGFLEGQIAVATAAQGNFAEARALNERIEFEDMRRSGEAAITQAEVLDLVKRGKAEEALQMAQGQEEPRARMMVLCVLVRRFALDKDAQRARKALDLAIEATGYLDPNDRISAPRYVAEAEATVGDVRGARARASTMAEPQSRDMTYCFVAAAQVRTGDTDGANQTMASVGGSGRATGYGLCANTSLERQDEANARRFVQQAIAAYLADPDTRSRSWALTYIVAAQTRLGDTAGAMALTRGESNLSVQALAYQNVALHETLRDGPAAAYALVQGLQSPLGRVYAWVGIARGLAARQKHADNQLPLGQSRALCRLTGARWTP
jgi:hypothetical protein